MSDVTLMAEGGAYAATTDTTKTVPAPPDTTVAPRDTAAGPGTPMSPRSSIDPGMVRVPQDSLHGHIVRYVPPANVDTGMVIWTDPVTPALPSFKGNLFGEPPAGQQEE